MQRGSVTHSQKGKEKLVLLGFVYNCNKRWTSTDGERISWDCELRKSAGCPAAVTTDGAYAVLSTREEHSHESREKRAQLLDTLHNIRRDAVQSDTKPAAILNRHVRKRMHAHLPSENNLKQAIYHIRKSKFPKEPATANEITLQNDWTLSLAGEPWNIADVRSNGERALVFATEDNLRHLGDAKVWLADGTFKYCPEQFQQLYVVHADCNGSVMPLLYVLMTRMTEALYEECLRDVAEVTREAFGVTLAPQVVVLDFERAAHRAFRTVFGDNVQVHGCHFHLCQALNRQVGNTGLRTRYNDDAAFAMKIRLLPALAYAPVERVMPLFDAVEREIGADGADIVRYFADCYVRGRVIRTGKRGRPAREVPMFPPEIWNCYEQFRTGNPTTNNACESWHTRLAAIMPHRHPGFWLFLSRLKEEQEHTESRLAQMDIGEPLKKKKRHSQQHRELRLRTLVDNASATGSFDVQYLRSVAQNFLL
jgi:hypothetical protein